MAEPGPHPSHDPTLADFTVIGVNYRDCPDAVREQLFVADEELPAILTALREIGFSEAVAVSTCDRVEIGGVTLGTAPELTSQVADLLGKPVGLSAGLLLPFFKRLEGEAAIRHWFRVASSLDAQVVGEPQVLGQVRANHKMAVDLAMTGPVCDAVLRHAYETAKRVRAETVIGERPVSIAACAARVARDIHGDLAACKGVLIGPGEFGLLVARQMLDAGLGDLTVIDRNPRRAEATARELGVHFAAFEELGPAMADAEVTMTALGDGRHVLGEDEVRATLKQRRHRPVFLVDLAMPRDIDPAVNRVEDAFLYDLEDLEGAALEGRTARQGAAEPAELIVSQELERFFKSRAEREAVPLIRALRDHFETERARMLAERPTADADEVSRALLNRLLHQPIQMLRDWSADGSLDPAVDHRIRQLFGLNQAEEQSNERGQK